MTIGAIIAIVLMLLVVLLVVIWMLFWGDSKHETEDEAIARIKAEQAEMSGKPIDENASKLIPCPDCGNQVSRYATSCPKCGRPFSSENIVAQAAHTGRSSSGRGLSVLAIALAVVIGILVAIWIASKIFHFEIFAFIAPMQKP